MNVRLYIRVSSEEQVKHGLSLEAQKNELLAYCKEMNYHVMKIYADEGISGGSIKKRLAYQQMVKEAKSGEIILFTKIDRFSRNLLDALITIRELQDKNVCVKATSQDIDTTTTQGRTMLQLMLVIAQNEREMTSDRIHSVFESRIKQGYAISGRISLGYKKVDGKYVIDEENAYKIVELFEHYSLHGNMSETVKWWNEKYPEHAVNYHTLQKYKLKNTIYIGKHMSGLNDHFCEPIISEELFNKVQERMKKNINGLNGQKRTYIFSRLVRCEVCGTLLAGSYQGTGYKYYRCNNAHQNAKCTNQKYISEGKLEKRLVKELENVVTGEYSLEITNVKTTEEINKEISSLNSKIERAEELYIDGDITKEKYQSRIKPLKEKIETLMKEKSSNVNKVMELINTDIVELYKLLDDTHKQAFWHEYVENIIFSPDGSTKIIFK